jgi:hypothetical protein
LTVCNCTCSWPLRAFMVTACVNSSIQTQWIILIGSWLERT